MPRPTADDPEQVLRDGAMDAAAAAAFSGLSETVIRGLVAAGELRSFTVGRRRLIPRAAVVAWLAGQLARHDAGCVRPRPYRRRGSP